MLKNKLNYFLIHNYEILLLILVIIYFYYQKIPTSVNNGWLGGFDQSKLLESSLAFKDFDLSSDKQQF